MNTFKEIFHTFFKLGWIAFGGPAAHIAMMEEEVVRKKKWISEQHFLDLVGATNLIPGPNSTEMTMHCGYEKGGIGGLFVAGLSFILPAAFLTGLLGYFYVNYGQIPQVEAFLFGIKPAVLAIILQALIKLGKKAWKSWWIGGIGILVAISSLLGLSEVIAILLGGLLALILKAISDPSSLKFPHVKTFFPPFYLAFLSFISPASGKIFWVFLKIGAILFGSGYVLVAYMEGEFIHSRGWLTEAQLLDAIAIGQLTPGPVLTTATFVGYQLGGFQGAVLATLGIFLPSFLYVWLLNPLIPRLRNSPWARNFLDGVNIGAMGIIAATLLLLGKSILIDAPSLIIAGLSALLIFSGKNPGSLWIVLGSSLLGYVFHLIG